MQLDSAVTSLTLEDDHYLARTSGASHIAKQVVIATGPFQVPFEVFIPEKVDGLVLAEKNISQSRLVSGATRLQPITMLTGQAAGAIRARAPEAVAA